VQKTPEGLYLSTEVGIMCRNIKQLRQPDQLADDEEITLAALQYIRKVSGYRKPSQVNSAAFDRAVSEVAEATKRLLESLAPIRR
jgi:hypothetical protein